MAHIMHTMHVRGACGGFCMRLPVQRWRIVQGVEGLHRFICRSRVLLLLGTGRTRKGDLQAVSNTAKCQLSRALHSEIGLADPVRIVGEAGR